MIRMCQYKFINYNKCITVDIDSGESCASVDTGGILELSVLYAVFCYESKAVSKNKVYLEGENHKC